MTSQSEYLTPEELLRLLFGALHAQLEFDALATVLCREGRDCVFALAARPLTAGFAEMVANDLVESFYRFSRESHRDCSRGPLRLESLSKDGVVEGEAWNGPAASSVDAPLIVAGRVIGLVRVLARTQDAFSPEQTAVIYASAQQASAFLERLGELRTTDHELLESLVNGLQDGIVVVDEQMHVLLFNDKTAALLAEITENGQKAIASLDGTPLGPVARRALQLGETQQEDFSFSEESHRYLSATATPLNRHSSPCAVVVLRDVTEERLMQERLLQSEKMASVGQLVSGVAHELNNPLTGVTGFAQILLQRQLDAETRRAVETILSEAERAAKIVDNLLSFARRRKAQKGLVNLNTLLERVLELRNYDLRVKNIDLDLSLDPHLPLTMGDPDQLQQVFFNILTNAEHSMLDAHGKGKLRIRSRVEKGFIHIAFTDDGGGIAPENLRRVFDPFFSTKEAGQGTGLGLTISYGIIDEHGGRIRVESRAGKGATLIVELPIVQGAELPAAKPEEEIALPKISRRILIVDDEENILALLRDVLTADGHRVDTARNGEDALTYLSRHGYDLLITDIKMPGMGGQALYQRVKQLDSELARNTVFITGDTVAADTRTFLDRIDNVCLAKPFKIREVRETLGRLLGD